MNAKQSFREVLWSIGLLSLGIALGCLVGLKTYPPPANNTISNVFAFSALFALCFFLTYLITALIPAIKEARRKGSFSPSKGNKK